MFRDARVTCLCANVSFPCSYEWLYRDRKPFLTKSKKEILIYKFVESCVLNNFKADISF